MSISQGASADARSVDQTFVIKGAEYSKSGIPSLGEDPLNFVGFIYQVLPSACPSDESGRLVRAINMHPNRQIYLEGTAKQRSFVHTLQPQNISQPWGCEFYKLPTQLSGWQIPKAQFKSGPQLQFSEPGTSTASEDVLSVR
jgi:hypothetical protein